VPSHRMMYLVASVPLPFPDSDAALTLRLSSAFAPIEGSFEASVLFDACPVGVKIVANTRVIVLAAFFLLAAEHTGAVCVETESRHPVPQRTS